MNRHSNNAAEVLTLALLKIVGAIVLVAVLANIGANLAHGVNEVNAALSHVAQGK